MPPTELCNFSSNILLFPTPPLPQLPDKQCRGIFDPFFHFTQNLESYILLELGEDQRWVSAGMLHLLLLPGGRWGNSKGRREVLEEGKLTCQDSIHQIFQSQRKEESNLGQGLLRDQKNYQTQSCRTEPTI